MTEKLYAYGRWSNPKYARECERRRNQLIYYLDKQRISQSQFAQMIGTTQSYVNHLVSGRRTLSYTAAAKIVAAIGANHPFV